MFSARIGVRFASRYWTVGGEHSDAFSQDWSEVCHPLLARSEAEEKNLKKGARSVADTYAMMYQALEGAKERLGWDRNLTWHSFRIGSATRGTVLGGETECSERSWKVAEWLCGFCTGGRKSREWFLVKL
jgi:hypothetical protein